MRIRSCGVTRALGVCMMGMGISIVFPAMLRAQQTGQLASDILGSTDLAYNPTFFGYALQAGPTAHSVA